MLRNECCPLFSVLIHWFFCQSHFKQHKARKTVGCLTSIIGICEYKRTEKWRCTQHEEAFFRLNWEYSFSHFLFCSQFKEKQDPFISPTEGYSSPRSGSNFPRNVTSQFIVFYAGSRQWQLKGKITSCLNLTVWWRYTAHITNIHTMPCRGEPWSLTTETQEEESVLWIHVRGNCAEFEWE